MRSGFRPRDRDEHREHGGELDGFWTTLEGVLGCKEKGAFTVTRFTVGVSNDLQVARNLTGGLPVLYQGRLTRLGPFREHLTPAHNDRQKGDTGGHRSAGSRNGQRGKCSDA